MEVKIGEMMIVMHSIRYVIFVVVFQILESRYEDSG